MSNPAKPNAEQQQRRDRETVTAMTTESPIVCIKTKADHNQLLGVSSSSSGGSSSSTKLTEKPPPGPVKRKKKLDRSLVDLSCSPKMEQKRQKTTSDAELPAAASASSTSPSTSAVDIKSRPPPPLSIPPKEPGSGRGSKAKELQNHTLFKWRRKNEETNAALVQKLNAYTEQLRLEINDLKTALISERNAVRALRAQQEAVTRKLRMEAKQTKEQQQSQLHNNHQNKKMSTKCAAEMEPANYTVQCSKLQHEIAVLKEQNKILEGKIQSSADADKKKVSDIRGLKEAYDLRLTQVTKSAKLEIHRLLEEIKAKDRAMQIMRKDLLMAKDSKKSQNMRKDTPKTASTPIAKPAPTNLLVESVKPPLSQAEQNENADPKQLGKGNDIEMMNTINLRSELEFVQTENDILKSELNSAQEEIKRLKATLAVTKDDEKSIYERIKVLEFKESELLKEAHELREQNDLLEFRIVELEESHDKWSLRSHPTPPPPHASAQQHSRDVWTDSGAEKEPDDLMMMSERSDSGVTSPHSNHQSEDRLSMPSPCDLAMIDSDNDDIRKRILGMTKRSCYDEEDKIALMQVLSLLNNLEALSQDHEISGEFSSLDSMANGAAGGGGGVGKQEAQKASPHPVPVATVQPFTDSGLYEEPITPQLKNSLRGMTTTTSSTNSKVMLWNSLQESGFEEQMVAHQATQTHTDEFPLPERPGDLTAEIQKLYKFRERIEEVVGHKKGAAGAGQLLSPDQRKLEYYKERAEALESKLVIYESSDDVQVRRLGERLQREVQLEALAKRMRQSIAELEKANQVLEEERCEFEEAENDTRLKFQRLEVDFELMTQRNVELEMGEEALQAKLQEAKKQLAIFEERVRRMELRIAELEALKRTACGADQPADTLTGTVEGELRQQVGEMLKREQAMQQNLDELKRAYNETLENADNVWAEMENEYKDKLKECAMNEQGLQSKLQQLEERIEHDSQFAQERLLQMEELEASLKQRISALNRDNKDLAAKYASLLDEFDALKEEYQKLKVYLSGPAAEILERERRKVGCLEDELRHSNEMLVQMEARSKDGMLGLKLQMTAAIKELENIRITNGELQEEVDTLEARVLEAKRLQTVDEETIRQLTEELRVKQRQLNNYQTSVYKSTQPNLAQELGSANFPILLANGPVKAGERGPQKGVKRVAESMLSLEQNGKPKLLPKPEDIPRLIIRAKEP